MNVESKTANVETGIVKNMVPNAASKGRLPSALLSSSYFIILVKIYENERVNRNNITELSNFLTPNLKQMINM